MQSEICETNCDTLNVNQTTTANNMSDVRVTEKFRSLISP